MADRTNHAADPAYTPAAGLHILSPLYDRLLPVLTREERWRRALIAQLSPIAGEMIADVGCGTGSLLARLAAVAPDVHYVGIDPDPAILDRARHKLGETNADIRLVRGFGRDTAGVLGGWAVTKIVSSLMFHQVPMEEKVLTLRAMFDALSGGGELHIADYAFQPTPMMRLLFRITVQMIDGRADTDPQARGILPGLIRQAGFVDVVETRRFATPTGSISLFRAVRPG